MYENGLYTWLYFVYTTLYLFVGFGFSIILTAPFFYFAALPSGKDPISVIERCDSPICVFNGIMYTKRNISNSACVHTQTNNHISIVVGASNCGWFQE